MSSNGISGVEEDRAAMARINELDNEILGELEVLVRGGLKPKVTFSYLATFGGSGYVEEATLVDVLTDRENIDILVFRSQQGSRMIFSRYEVFAFTVL
jgi:hypothetical protein